MSTNPMINRREDVVPYATPVGRTLRPSTAVLAGGGLVAVAAVVLLVGIVTAAEYKGILGSDLTVTALVMAGLFSLICLVAGLILLFRGSRG